MSTVVAHPERRNLPSSGLPRVTALLGRAVKRQCPECGAGGIFTNWFTIKDACPNCGYVFAREGGYFLGAYALNLVAAEFITVALLIAFLIKTDYHWVVLEAIFIPMAIILPLVFFPYSRMLWMALDLSFTHENQR
jgi:uncharacterized protein (DUF983 family)